MKRVLFVVCLALMVVAMGWTQTLTLMNNGIVKFSAGEDQIRPYVGVIEMLAAKFEAAHPGVKVNMVYRDVSKGSLTFDAMLAAGTPPDVWIDAGGYMPDYMTDNYALRLDQYVDTSIYRQDLLELWKRTGSDGKQYVYCLPLVNIALGMAINTDMLAQVGYTLPSLEKWTTTEFLALAAKLKAVGIPATAIQGEGGLNGWTDYWLYAHGAAMFKNGDYTKTAINSPEARAALAFIKAVIDNGYTTPPLETNDDDAVELFTVGKLFSSAMQNGHTDYWIPEQAKQGKIPRVFGYTFVEFPHAPGMAHAPVSGYQTVVIAHKNKNEAINKLAAELAALVAGKESQWYYSTITGGFPTIKGFSPDIGTAAYPSYKAIAALSATAGTYKEWPDGPKGKEAQRIWKTLSEQWLRGKLTADALLAQFEREANKILK